MPNTYLKYPEIENSYQERNLTYWKEKFPGILNLVYTIEEKIHGTNIQLEFDGSKDMTIGTRKVRLGEGHKHMGFRTTLEKYKNFCEVAHLHASMNKRKYTLYGELFGLKIQKGVNYGTEKHIRFFGLRINGELQSQEKFYNFMASVGFPELIIKRLATVHGLGGALAYQETFRSTYTPEDTLADSGVAEGIVIKPFGTVVRNTEGDIFYLKKKSEKFKEKARTPKVHVDSDRRPNPLLEYINENRIESEYSKSSGKIKYKAEIAGYIKRIKADVIKDYNKEHDVPYENLKGNYSPVGNVIAKLLLKDL